MSLCFLFVQFEFTHALGPHTGRYVVEPAPADAPAEALVPAGLGAVRSRREVRRDEVIGVALGVGEADVLVISTEAVDAIGRRLRIRRRPRLMRDGAKPDPVPLMLATFVRGSRPLANEAAADLAFERLRASEKDQLALVDEGLSELNRAIRAYRAGARDPYVTEVMARDARQIRIGYGTTEDVGNARWQAAAELSTPAPGWRRRSQMLRPFETVAAVLGRRMEVLEAEDVLGRALIDLDQGRTRAAAQQVSGALLLLLGEAGADPEMSVELELGPLTARTGRAQELAALAVDRPLEPGEVAELETLVALMTSTIDAWRYE
jgi:hypothetical protein